MSTSCSSNNDFTHFKKPYFTIELSAKRLGIEIRMNDIPAFTIDNSGFMTLEVPVNQFIINGDNELKVITHPIFDENNQQKEDYISDASVEVGLYVREDGQKQEDRKLISKILISPNNSYTDSSNEPTAQFVDQKSNNSLTVTKDATILNYPVYNNYKKQVVTSLIIKDLKSSFPRWQWQDGQKIVDNDSSYQSLLDAYTSLHEAYAKKDLAQVKAISKPHSEEIAIAYHLSNADAGFDYISLGKYIDHPEVKLLDRLYLNNTKFEILGNGKIARIMNAAQTHPILFLNYENEQLYKIQFMWYLNKNNEWVLIR